MGQQRTGAAHGGAGGEARLPPFGACTTGLGPARTSRCSAFCASASTSNTFSKLWLERAGRGRGSQTTGETGKEKGVRSQPAPPSYAAARAPTSPDGQKTYAALAEERRNNRTRLPWGEEPRVAVDHGPLPRDDDPRRGLVRGGLLPVSLLTFPGALGGHLRPSPHGRRDELYTVALVDLPAEVRQQVFPVRDGHELDAGRRRRLQGAGRQSARMAIAARRRRLGESKSLHP